MIRVGLLIDRLEGRTRHVIEIVSLLIGGFFVAFFTYYAALLTFDSWRFHDMAQGVLAIPLWIPQLGYSSGLFILLVAFIDEFVHVLRGNLPRYEKPKPQTAEEVVEQAIQSGV
jgi:TRAP-type C4-dicarboxylate transport system permease small subunit